MKPLGNVLTRLCKEAEELVIAAPYIKVNALSRVLEEVSRFASIVCVTRWNPHDLALGASDTECRTIITKFGGSFKLHPTLHAKYFRINNFVLVGSANLTDSGMGWSYQSNLEILCGAGTDFDARAFEKELLIGAREIGDDEFARWEDIDKINFQSEHEFTIQQPILDSWRPATRDPQNLSFSYHSKEDVIASFDEQNSARTDIRALQIPIGLSDEQFRKWTYACLLAAPFTNSVMQLQDLDPLRIPSLLAEIYNIENITDARRDMETVHNWLTFFSPEVNSRKN